MERPIGRLYHWNYTIEFEVCSAQFKQATNESFWTTLLLVNSECKKDSNTQRFEMNTPILQQLQNVSGQSIRKSIFRMQSSVFIFAWRIMSPFLSFWINVFHRMAVSPPNISHLSSVYDQQEFDLHISDTSSYNHHARNICSFVNVLSVQGRIQKIQKEGAESPTSQDMQQ